MLFPTSTSNTSGVVETSDGVAKPTSTSNTSRVVETAPSGGVTKPTSTPNTPRVVETDPSLCVIVRSMSEQYFTLKYLVYSLLSGRYPNLYIYVINTNSNKETENLVQVSVKEMNHSRVQYLPLLPKYSNEQDFGYIMTDVARIVLLNMTKEWNGFECNYFLFTNGDNFYFPNFLPEVGKHMRAGKDMIGVNFWSHQQGALISVQWRVEHVDLGSAVMSRDVVSKAHFRKYQYYWFAADWAFFEQCLQTSNTSTVIVPQYLFTHI